MEDNERNGLVLSLAIGIAVMAACGVLGFAVMLMGLLVF